MSRHIDAAAGIIASSFVAGGAPAPTLRAHTIGTNGGGPITAVEPTGAALNDVIFLFVIVQATGASNITINPPVGWSTAVATHNDNTGVVRYCYAVFWIRRGAIAPSYVVTITNGPAAYNEWCVSAWQGCTTSGTPFDASAVANDAVVNPSNPTCPPVTTLTANSTVVLQGVSWGGCDAPGFSAPSGYTIIDNAASLGVGTAQCTAYQAIASTGLTTPGAFSGAAAGADDCGGCTIALHG